MGIDRIGKGGPPVPPKAPESAPVGGAARPGETRFEAHKPEPLERAGQAGQVQAPRTALDRLRAGEIDVKGYLDAKVDEATSHLASMPPVELEAIRKTLRDRLAHDPSLADLVRTATGRDPPSPDDE